MARAGAGRSLGASEAPKPSTRGAGRPHRLKWAVDAPTLSRLREEWAKLTPEFREAARMRALRGGKYLFQMLEGKGDRGK